MYQWDNLSNASITMTTKLNVIEDNWPDGHGLCP